MRTFRPKTPSPLFVVDWTNSSIPWEAEAWPISLAVFWVAWRDQNAIEREWALDSQPVFWLDRPKLPRQLLCMRDAQEVLWQALSNAKVEAWTAFENDERGRVVCDRRLPACRWTSFMRFDANRMNLVFQDDRSRESFGFVTIPRSRLIELWPSLPHRAFWKGEPKGKPGPKSHKMEAAHKALVELGSAQEIEAYLRGNTKRIASSFEISLGTLSKCKKAAITELEQETCVLK